jgi:hypothetical protein
MNMREKYDHAIQVAKGLRMQGSADEKNGKLYFNGVVKSEDEKNQIWNAIKTVSSWQSDVVADIRVEAAPRRRGCRSRSKAGGNLHGEGR